MIDCGSVCLVVPAPVYFPRVAPLIRVVLTEYVSWDDKFAARRTYYGI